VYSKPQYILRTL